MIAVFLALVTACAGHPPPPAGPPPAAKPTTQDTPSARPVTSTPSPAVVVGVPGHYRVGERQLTFLEPAHTGPTGQYLGQNLGHQQSGRGLYAFGADHHRRHDAPSHTRG